MRRGPNGRGMRAAGVVALSVASLPAWGQAPTTGLPLPSRPVPIEQPRPLQPRPLEPSPLRGAPKPMPPAVPSAPEGAPTMVVRQFRFTGNTVISTAELERLTASYLDRPVTFAALSEARNAISQLYLNKGYTTSGAYIPMQTSADGVVEIRILEGRLGEVDIKVKGRLQPEYIRSRLRRAGRGPLNVPRLLEQLRLLQANPLIQTISAELSASAEPGLSTLRVQAVSARSSQAAVAMDNGRNPQTGSMRRGVDLSEANLLGFGDGLSLIYRNSDGANDTQFSYQMPLNSSDLTLTASYRTLNSWVIEEPLSALNLYSRYEQIFAGLRQPILRRVDEELGLGISLNKQNNKGLFLEGLPFPARGVNPNGESRVATLSFTQDWLRRSTRDVLAFRSEIGIGINGLDTTTPYDYGVDPDSPDANFFLWRADGQYVRQLAKDTTLISRLRAQVADHPLPSVEQFALGGLGSVQGYQTNSLLTDSGLFASLEVALPLLRWKQGNGLLQVVPFTAIGFGWDAGQAPQPPVNTLGSVGVGLQVRLGEAFQARVDYGQRLGPTPYQLSDAWQDQAVLFTVRYAP